MRALRHVHSALLLTQASYSSTVIEGGSECLTPLLSEWEEIALDGDGGEPFFQPYWIKAFAESFERGRPLSIIVTREGERLRGVLPFVKQKRFFGGIPARTLRSLSGIHSCRFDLTCAPKSHARVAAATWQTLKRNASWDVIEALNVPLDGTFPSIMRAAQEDGFLTGTWPTLLTPILPLPAKSDDPFAESPTKHKQFRARLKNYEKKLESYGELSLEVNRRFSKEQLDLFIELEASGWKGKIGGAIARNSRAVQFYHQALKEAAQRGHLCVHTLRVGASVVAMELGLVMNNRYYSPKVTYDERFSNCSPGHLLNRWILTSLAAEGVYLVDFLGPRARHKAIWTDKVRPHAHCYIIRPTLAGRLRHAAALRAAPLFRRMKHARYGDPQAV